MANLVPNAATASAAKKGLRLYEDGKGGDGLVAATIRDAKKMAGREALSEQKVRKMPAWFARHEVDRKPGWDTAGEETPGYVAWLLWGGDAGRRWAEARVKELDKETEVGRSNPAAHESRDILSAGDRLLADALVDGVEETGRFDAEAAEYLAAGAEGHQCAGCVFYRGDEYAGPEGCVIVAADVQPGGGCRLGIQGQLPIDEEAEEADAGEMPEPGEETLADALEDVDESLDLGESDEDDDEEGDEEGGVTVNVNIDFDAYSHNAEGMGSATGVETGRSVERHVSRSSVEWQERESGVGPNYRTLTGHAAVFDVPSEDLGGFVEVISPGAFSRALEEGADVRLLWNHDPSTIMARTTNGSLELTEDDLGLKVWARVDMADPDVSRLVGKIRSGLVTQMSFAFSIPDGGDEWTTRDGFPLRTVREVDGLYDVSAVTYPAYPNGTKVDVMERAIASGRISPNNAASVSNPADVASSRNSTGEALERLRAKARSRIAVVTFNLSR